jgi:ActR/RegA family two-component response regulator
MDPIAVEPCTPSGQKPPISPRRLAANRQNSMKSHGRPPVAMDWTAYNQSALKGWSVAQTARHLGISRRTLKRRVAERRRNDSPIL